IDAGEIGSSQSEKGVVVVRRVGAFTRALEQEMIKAEGKIESGIAEPGAFGVEEHRPGKSLEDVLRTDVAVNQSALRRQRRTREFVESRCELRVRAASRAQIRLDSDRFERLVVGERGWNTRVGR